MAGTARDFFEKSTMSTFLPGDLVEKEEVMLRIHQLEDDISRKDDDLARRTRMALGMESELTLLNEQNEDLKLHIDSLEEQHKKQVEDFEALQRAADEAARAARMRIESELTLLSEQNDGLKRRIESSEEQHKKQVEEFQALQRAADEAARAARAELDMLNSQPQHTNAPLKRKMQAVISMGFGIIQFTFLLISQSHEMNTVKDKKGLYISSVVFSGFSILCSIYGIWLELEQEGFTRQACHGVFWWFDHQNNPYVPIISLFEVELGIGGFVTSIMMMGEMKRGCNSLSPVEVGIACAQFIAKFASLLRFFFKDS